MGVSIEQWRIAIGSNTYKVSAFLPKTSATSSTLSPSTRSKVLLASSLLVSILVVLTLIMYPFIPEIAAPTSPPPPRQTLLSPPYSPPWLTP